jgi:uncharacterized phage protein gp47/JayE
MTQANYIDLTGIHVQDLAEITAEMTLALQTIYGFDINISANSPDGQLIGIYSQAKADMLDTVVQVFNSMSPGKAVGRVLDQRVAYNGIIRQGATFTIVPITVTTDRVLTLAGLDTSPDSPFTVSDLSGNNFQLLTTTTTTAGANILSFQSAVAGAILTTLNTITVVSTLTLGVLAVNNPSPNSQDGKDEETDVQLRSRREASVSNPSVGFLDGLTGQLKSILGVTDAIVYENITSVVDVNGIPGHSMWAIVAGGADTDIADAIYRKRNAGCGIKGSSYVDILQINGTTFRVFFDRPVENKLYIKLVTGSIDPAHTPDTTYIAAQLLALLSYNIYQSADFTAITALVKSLDPLCVVTAGGVAGPYPYDSGKTYNISDLVSYGAGNAVYKCKLMSLGNDPTNGTYWDAYSLVLGDFEIYRAPQNIQGQWSLDATRITVT